MVVGIARQAGHTAGSTASEMGIAWPCAFESRRACVASGHFLNLEMMGDVRMADHHAAHVTRRNGRTARTE